MKNETHLMFDIETLGNKSNPVITQIAVVAFQMDGTILDEFDVKIKIDSCINIGLNIDVSTLEWWSLQDQELYRKINFEGYRLTIWDALESLKLFVGTASAYKVWGNGPNFDFRHLSTAYESVGFRGVPWKFWQERCVRTMKDVLVNNNIEIDFEGEPHNAIDDCKHQIKMVCKAHELIYNK